MQEIKKSPGLSVGASVALFASAFGLVGCNENIESKSAESPDARVPAHTLRVVADSYIPSGKIIEASPNQQIQALSIVSNAFSRYTQVTVSDSLGDIQKRKVESINILQTKMREFGLLSNTLENMSDAERQIKDFFQASGYHISFNAVPTEEGKYAYAPALVKTAALYLLDGSSLAIQGFEQHFPKRFEVLSITSEIIPMKIGVTRTGEWDTGFMATLGRNSSGEYIALIKRGDATDEEVFSAAVNELGNAAAKSAFQIPRESLISINFAGGRTMADRLQVEEAFSDLTELRQGRQSAQDLSRQPNLQRYALSKEIQRAAAEQVGGIDSPQYQSVLIKTYTEALLPLKTQ